MYRIMLKNELARRSEVNARYSLRSYAKALGFEATNISQMIAGKRVPSVRTANRLIERLGLSPNEKNQFLVSLAKAQQKRSLKELNRLIESQTEISSQELNIELFRTIADWWHYAILALTQTVGFKNSQKWIASQLGISEIETSLAIDRLLTLGLLKRNKNSLQCSDSGFTTANKDVTTSALRQHQKQILEKALASLENDPIETRSMTGMTMAIDPRNLAEAKRRIEKFTQELSALLETGTQSRVYQLGVSLFPVQKENK